MATYTTNINLLKPAEQEKYDVNLRNNNWDKIDKAVGDGANALKAHKEANPIDHPDGSVTTPKLRDASVTTPKLADSNVTTAKLADKSVTAAKLADDINNKLDNSYVKKAGDTMTGDLTFGGNNQIRINRKAGGGYHTIGDGGTNGGETNLNLGNPQVTPESNLCCYNRPGWFGKNKTSEFNPLVVFSDLNDYTLSMGRTQPELTPLMDWDRMKTENNGVDVRNITVDHSGGKLKAYGGDTGALTTRYKSYSNSPIILKQSFKNFDAVMIRFCDDDGFNYGPKIFPTWLLDYQFRECYDVTLFHQGVGWHVWPYKNPPDLAANYNPSTETVWTIAWQNCGIIEIYGINYKRL